MTAGSQPTARALPIAEPFRIRRAALRLIRLDGRAFAAAIGLNALAAAAGLLGPWLLGRIIDEVRAGGGVATVDRLALTILVFALAQLVLLGTVRDNLQIASACATDAELRTALVAVGAEWANELPDGLDTDLGHGGHRPDGAQAQQLALARVVLADPHMLILDEAIALLDPRTARRTERALAAVLAGRTVVAIAHRLQTAHDAARVAVMDDGRLTELGTHDNLVAADGAYATLWRSWHGERPPSS